MFIRSPGIEWNSPRSLAKSTVGNISKSYSLGHVNIRIACENREVLTGIYNRYSNETKDAVRKKGYGLGVLFNLFEGTLQKPKFIIPSFQNLTKENRTNFVTFKISSTTCQRLLDYHDQYETIMTTRQASVRRGMKPSHGQQIYYGFPAIPRNGEGGGCSGFALSYLEVAGIKEQWMVNEWSQSVLVPASTVGRPMRNDNIGLRALLFSSPQRWATPNEANFPLFFWDPDMMVRSTTAKINSRSVLVTSLYGSTGYILDRTHVPTPTEPIFLNDPVNNPSDPTEVYNNIEELLRRYEISREVSLL